LGSCVGAAWRGCRSPATEGSSILRAALGDFRAALHIIYKLIALFLKKDFIRS